MTVKTLKRKKLRHNEYYNTQDLFDSLYKASADRKTFKDLISIIGNEQNILLAYRNIKRNGGSLTPGVDGKTVKDLEKQMGENLVGYVRTRLTNYVPHMVRRTYIEKSNGGQRPLGIPTMEDRLLQQCILQVLEAICEAKFHKHSYGFRSNRSQHDALARLNHLINRNGLHYIVDVDIKGFFDNVNHGKLLKQLWSLGIRDKNFLCLISKLLKAEIKGEGIPDKGTPQGGIISPLLSNIVLNELDWWINSQWEGFLSKKTYSVPTKMYRELKKTKLKEMYIVRYADDFKILCRDPKTAHKTFNAVKQWLKRRLGLDINLNKSKVLNLRKNYTEFLGFKVKAEFKGTNKNKYYAKSHMTDRKKDESIRKIRDAIIKMQKETTAQNVNRYNSLILGLHNYFKVATHTVKDFQEIAERVHRIKFNRLKKRKSKTGTKSKAFIKFYGDYNYKMEYVRNIALYPIRAIRHRTVKNYLQEKCPYTLVGRKSIHRDLKDINMGNLRQLMENPISKESLEYNDNRLSLYVAQKGKCFVTGNNLFTDNFECHHKKPRKDGGDDRYQNLVLVLKDVHILIHATKEITINKYIKELKIDDVMMRKLNKLRVLAGVNEIGVNITCS